MSKYARAATRDIEEDKPAEKVERHCYAFGCPELGSISSSAVGAADSSEWWCRFHFGTPSDQWAEITRSRRLAADEAKSAPPVDTRKRRADGSIDVDYYRERLKGTRGASFAQPGKDWARKLKQREEDGAQLSECQREAWRTALREPREVEVQ